MTVAAPAIPGPYQVYAADSTSLPRPADAAGITAELWRPGLTSAWPPPERENALLAFWVYHLAHAFAHRDYAAVIVRVDGVVAHRSMVYPPYFAFPFMGRDDIQVGNTLTVPAFRGRGLAVRALQEAGRLLGRPGRRLWYIADEANVTSCRVAERAGLAKVATARRYPRFGVHQLGGFVLDRPPTASP